MNEALFLGDRICVMKEGKIVQTDTPEQIRSNPANDFVAQFFQQDHSSLENYCVADLLELGLVEDGQVNSKTTVTIDTALPEVIRLLVDGKTVVLVDEKGPIGEITDRTILRFLETKIEKGDQ